MPEFPLPPVQIGGFKYAHINTNTLTGLSSMMGHLHAIVINTAGAAGNTCKVVDSATAAVPVIAVIDTTVMRTLTYNTTFRNGLIIITAGGVTAADITVVYQ